MSAMSGFHRHIVALALVAGTVSTAEAEERRQTTVDLVAEIAAGRTTAEQAVGAALQRIEKASALNAVARLDAARALATLQAHPLGREAALIGEVSVDPRHFVQMRTRFGGRRMIDWLAGDALPRIC